MTNQVTRELSDLIAKRDAQEHNKIRRITFHWVRWNARKISIEELVDAIGEILKGETKQAWLEYVGKAKAPMDDENPLNSLVV